jgi:hypothetical protein
VIQAHRTCITDRGERGRIYTFLPSSGKVNIILGDDHPRVIIKKALNMGEIHFIRDLYDMSKIRKLVLKSE